jgi:hypothetical protein
LSPAPSTKYLKIIRHAIEASGPPTLESLMLGEQPLLNVRKIGVTAAATLARRNSLGISINTLLLPVPGAPVHTRTSCAFLSFKPLSFAEIWLFVDSNALRITV